MTRQQSTAGCVYYLHTGKGYVGAIASRNQAHDLDQYSVLICSENEVSNFPLWGNEKANAYVLEKAVSLGFSRIGSSAFFERLEGGAKYVYFIEAVGLQRVKIGYSADPTRRLKQLSTGSPVELRIHSRMPGDEAMEKDIHARFQHLRIQNEWFHFSPEIRAYAGQNCV